VLKAERFDKVDTHGSGTVSIEEWLAHHKLERVAVMAKDETSKFHTYVKDALHGLKKIDKEIKADPDVDLQSSKGIKHFEKLRTAGGLHNLMAYNVVQLTPADIKARRKFMRNRKLVANKIRKAAKWTNELTDAMRQASAIAIALSYEQVFEGVDVYSTAIWLNGDEDCMKEQTVSTAIRAFCVVGCAVVAFVGWYTFEWMEKNLKKLKKKKKEEWKVALLQEEQAEQQANPLATNPLLEKTNSFPNF